MDFEELLDLQLNLQKSYFRKFYESPQEAQLLHTTRSMIHEIIEVERELNYKHWKKPVPVNPDKLKNEIVDVFIFFMNLVNISGMSKKELFDLTLYKMEINKGRQDEGY